MHGVCECVRSVSHIIICLMLRTKNAFFIMTNTLHHPGPGIEYIAYTEDEWKTARKLDP